MVSLHTREYSPFTYILSVCDLCAVSTRSVFHNERQKTTQADVSSQQGIQTNKKDPITDYALACAVVEVISDIVCIQRDRDLWRINVDSIENRKLLLSDGFTLQNIRQ